MQNLFKKIYKLISNKNRLKIGILKLIAIALFGFCFSLGINFLSPILAQSSPSSLIQQGVKLLQQGRAEAALEVWQQAEVIYRKNKDRIGEIRSQVNQAQALTSMGFYRRSCDTVLQAFGNDLQCERLT
ncbi:hypothetical protein [Okeania sp. SIO2B9]|uniref:hypothetical protein n=1 Tax=Okeania sp. SIO2B9 TaxID=2607782 RepID=UPI002580299E|nr:hypothetical protein [Okeania sp. SIO2B9]